MRLDAEDVGSPLGALATFVQLSSAFCGVCRACRLVLERVVATSEGVRFIDLDVADHPDLAERLDVRSTPTVVLLGADGTVVRRMVGAPRLAQARAVLAAL